MTLNECFMSVLFILGFLSGCFFLLLGFLGCGSWSHQPISEIHRVFDGEWRDGIVLATMCHWNGHCNQVDGWLRLDFCNGGTLASLNIWVGE